MATLQADPCSSTLLKRFSESPGDMARLLQVPYFASLGDEALEAVAGRVVQRIYEPGQIVFLEGEPCAGLYIVQSGRVKVFMVSLEGREQVLHVLGPGATFNDVAVFDGDANPASAMALERTKVWVVDRVFMLSLIHAYPALAMVVAGRLADMARRLLYLVETLSFCDVTGRLARLLLDRAQPGNALPKLSGRRGMTQAEMAAHLGTVREMVGRSLRVLEEEGLIEIDHHHILIHDAEKLKLRASM